MHLNPIEVVMSKSEIIARDVVRIPTGIANAYIIGSPDNWVLIDAGTPGNKANIISAVTEHMGANAMPRAIVLTHGHFDHAGAARELADRWGVPVYAHPLELPFLRGKSDYPPQDPTVGGALALLSRVFPHAGRDLGKHAHMLPADGVVPAMRDWRWISTPGHTPGHVSLFREHDGVLIAGDALATENQDSFFGMVTHRPCFNRPPAPFTTDWPAAQQSLRELGERPVNVVAAGHGTPIRAGGTQLREFAQQPSIPRKGRYVVRPALFDEDGVRYVPPPVRDPLPKIAVGVVIAALMGTTLWKLARK
jgi:glyoxylase-like metal-dependent hydrolase (beta-lactamase superfamily II)